MAAMQRYGYHGPDGVIPSESTVWRHFALLRYQSLKRFFDSIRVCSPLLVAAEPPYFDVMNGGIGAAFFFGLAIQYD